GTHFSTVIQALRLGLTSVMSDGSILPLDENIRTTCEIVRIAQEYGASVEAELGHVVTPDLEGEGDASFYTRPEEAKQFVAETGVDALAVAFGTAHGMYRREPKLDFNRLQAIKDSVGIPLVMHGGSGLTDDDYQKAIARGVNKINYYSYMSQDVAEHLKKRLNATQGHLFYHDMMLWAMEKVSEHIAEKIRLFGASGRA
ncbi:MAG TPA: class II fructose-bisphosphate aldolase, partial [Bacillota bacterium]|nr:class II fructose-bisphosphate aldolase [Bacillota bacterium]